jgi:hypothetical protein
MHVVGYGLLSLIYDVPIESTQSILANNGWLSLNIKLNAHIKKLASKIQLIPTICPNQQILALIE